MTLKILPKVVITSVHAELAPMRASGCFGIVNLWEEKIPNQLLSNKFRLGGSERNVGCRFLLVKL